MYKSNHSLLQTYIGDTEIVCNILFEISYYPFKYHNSLEKNILCRSINSMIFWSFSKMGEYYWKRNFKKHGK